MKAATRSTVTPAIPGKRRSSTDNRATPMTRAFPTKPQFDLVIHETAARAKFKELEPQLDDVAGINTVHHARTLGHGPSTARADMLRMA